MEQYLDFLPSLVSFLSLLVSCILMYCAFSALSAHKKSIKISSIISLVADCHDALQRSRVYRDIGYILLFKKHLDQEEAHKLWNVVGGAFFEVHRLHDSIKILNNLLPLNMSDKQGKDIKTLFDDYTVAEKVAVSQLAEHLNKNWSKIEDKVGKTLSFDDSPIFTQLGNFLQAQHDFLYHSRKYLSTYRHNFNKQFDI